MTEVRSKILWTRLNGNKRFDNENAKCHERPKGASARIMFNDIGRVSRDTDVVSQTPVTAFVCSWLGRSIRLSRRMSSLGDRSTYGHHKIQTTKQFEFIMLSLFPIFSNNFFSSPPHVCDPGRYIGNGNSCPPMRFFKLCSVTKIVVIRTRPWQQPSLPSNHRATVNGKWSKCQCLLTPESLS